MKNSPIIASRGPGYVELVPGKSGVTSNAAMHDALNNNGGGFSLDNIPSDTEANSEPIEPAMQPAPAPVAPDEAASAVTFAHDLAEKVPPPVNVAEPIKDNSCAPIWKVLREHVAPLVQSLKDSEQKYRTLENQLSDRGLLPGASHFLIKKLEAKISVSTDQDEIISLSGEIARLRSLNPEAVNSQLFAATISAPQRAGARMLVKEFFEITPRFVQFFKAAAARLSDLESEVKAAERELFERFGFETPEATGISIKIGKVRKAISDLESTFEMQKERCALPGYTPTFALHFPELGL